MTRLARILAVSALVLGIVGTPAAAGAHPQSVLPAVGSLPGDATDFSFRSFDADYQLGRDDEQHATLDATETLVALFPQSDQNHGIIRDIPASYGAADLQTEVISVLDGHGAPVPYDQDETGGFIQLQIGSAAAFVHGTTTYVIHYRQKDTIRHFVDTDDDEFYWDVNGTGWAQPFGRVSATVHVAADIVDDLDGHTACYQGAEGSTTPCGSGVQSTGLVMPETGTPATGTPEPSDSAMPDPVPVAFTASATDLAVGENLTIAIGFASGTFVDESGDGSTAPTGPDGESSVSGGELAGALLSLLGFPAVVIGTIGGALARRQRAEPARSTIIPQYGPPDGLDVMAAAQLVGRASTAVPAQLVSLAVRGKTRLLGYPVKSARAADYSVQLLDPTGLQGFEPPVVDALFGPDAKPGATHDLLTYGDTELAGRLRPVVDGLPDWLEQNGAYSGRRHTVGSIVVLVVTAALLLVAVVGAFLGGFAGIAFGFVSVVAGFVGLLVAIAGARGPKRLSGKGAQWNDHLLGMRMYLQLAEQDRLRVLQSPGGAERIDVGDGTQLVKLYEKLLPWAVIWGVEDQWSKVLEIELQRTGAAPDFWVGQAAFNAAVFTSLLGGLHQATLPVPTSTSGSSFSSFSGGSFGGGFSGGGGGGGGGGGW